MKVWLSAVVVAVVLTVCAATTRAQAPAPAPAPAPAAATPAPNGLQRIAYIDVQRVLARSAAGVAAREQLEREKATMQKEMDAKRVELEKLRDEMEKKGALLTPDARRDKQEQFERKRRDAARLADDFQKELEKKESGLLQKVLQDVSGVIERVGKEKNYYLVVEKRGGRHSLRLHRGRPHRRDHPAVRPRGPQQGEEAVAAMAKAGFTLGELAEVLHARLDGDPGRIVTGVAPLDSAGPDQISFLTDLRYRGAADASRAGAFLAPRERAGPARPHTGLRCAAAGAHRAAAAVPSDRAHARPGWIAPRWWPRKPASTRVPRWGRCAWWRAAR